MNFEYFVAKRLFFTNKKNNRHTRPILSIAILAIALSVAIMLLSFIIVKGFKQEISNKIIGFGSHIIISSYTDNQSYESDPIIINDSLHNIINNISEVKNTNVFATKAGIIKTQEEIMGVVLKGVSLDFDWEFFEQNLIDGSVIEINDSVKTNDVLISEEMSRKLSLDIGDDLIIYFIKESSRVRKFDVKGIYNTSFSDFDKLFILGDIRCVQQLNQWDYNQVGGLEVTICDFNKLDKTNNLIYSELDYDLNSITIKEKYPQLFDWLNLQDVNVAVILVLMLIVGVINMITALLILISERTRFIGILKAIGSNNWNIRKIFVYNATYLLIKGLFFGNIIAFVLALLQREFSIIKLDPQTYYMNTIPIHFDFLDIFLLNLGTVFICYLILLIPTIIVTKISPTKAISFQ